MNLIDLLKKSGLCKSKNEAKRLIIQGAVEIYEPDGTIWKPNPIKGGFNKIKKNDA